ncbi:MAG: hypothetical protein ACRDXF_11160 [Acidimicrobiia bacterium]
MTDDVTTMAEQPATAPTIEETTTSAAAEEAASTGMECALVPPDVVAVAFAATSASGAPGIARNCTFTLVDGLVPTVEVFHYGSSMDWDGLKTGFEENRGGVTEIPGIGDEAFQPNDVGPYEIVVRYLDIIYSVAVQTGTGGPEVEAAILELATSIAGG